MLYHIDNTPEMPSDRFGTGGYDKRYEQSGTVATDPVDPTDRAYINFGVKKGIEICYGRRREIYGMPEKYVRYTNERTFGEWLDGLYHKSKTDFDLYRKENPKGKNLIVKIGMKYYKCEETSVSSEKEVDIVWYNGLLIGMFLGLTLGFIGACILFAII